MAILIKNQNWFLYIVRGGVVSINIVAMLVLGIILDLEDYGRFTLLWSLILTVAAVASVGGHQYLLREMSQRQAGIEFGVSIRAFVKIVFLLPLTVLSFAISIFYVATNLSANIKDFIALNHLLMVFASAYINILITHSAIPLRVKGYSSLSMILQDGLIPMAILLSGLLYQYISTKEESVFGIIHLYIIISGVGLVASFIISYRLAGTTDLFSKKNKSSLSFNYWYNNILGVVSSQIDILIAGMFLSDTDLGIYGIIKRFANLLSFPQIIGDWIVAVEIGKFYAMKNTSAMSTLCLKGLKATVVPGLVLLVSSFAASPLVFSVYNIPIELYVYTSYAFLAIGSISNVFYGSNIMVANQCNLEQHSLIGRLLGFMVCSLCMLAIGQGLNLILASLISGVSILITQTYIWYVVKEKIKIDTSIISMTNVLASKLN